MNIIEEGGNAVNGRRIEQSEVPTIMEKVDEIFSTIGFKRGEDYDIVGSAGKKKDGDTSGDIDICVNRTRLVDALGLEGMDKKEILNRIVGLLNDNGYDNCVPSVAFNQVSFAMPINGPEDVVQIDFMIVNNLAWSRFMQASPDYRKDESKYKGLFRNILIMNIAKHIYRKTTKKVTFDDGLDGNGEEERYSIRLTDGLYKTRRHWFGKKGDRLVKTPSVMHEYDELITDTPQSFVDMIFTDTTTDDVISFESVYELLWSDKFKYPELRDKVIVSTVMAIDSQGFDIPEEIDQKYIVDAKEKEQKAEEYATLNKKRKIINVETFESKYIMSFNQFLNESVENSITVTFKEDYMEHEVTRTCQNMSKEQVIEIYGLTEPDIEWYQFEGEERVINHE